MSYEEFTNKEVKVNKEHQCCWCAEIIEKHNKAQYREYKFHGVFNRDYMHPECYKALALEDCDSVDEGWSPGDYPRGGIDRSHND